MQAQAFGFGWLGFGMGSYSWRPQTYVSSLPSTMTFARNSAITVNDNLSAAQTLPANQPAFEGLRYVTNLITYSNDLNGPGWQKTGAGTGLNSIVTSNTVVAPDGTLTAARLLLDVQGGRTSGDYSRVWYNGYAPVLKQGLGQVWLKSNTADSYTIQLWLGGPAATVTVTPTWQKFDFSHADTVNIQVIYFGNQATTNQADLAIWHVQYEEAQANSCALAGEYVPTLNGIASQPFAYLLGTQNITCWGDSITENTAGANGTSYPNVLKALYPSVGVKNKGVAGNTTAQVVTRFNADTGSWGDITVILTGYNYFQNKSLIMSGLASMVASLGANTKYLILTIPTGTNDIAGTATYISQMDTNNTILATYPNNSYDMRSYLVSQYNPSIPQDVIDHGNDIIPSSLRLDFIHPNAACSILMANKIKEFIDAKGWVVPGNLNLASSGVLNTRTGDNSTTAPSIITATSPFALTSGAWAFDITIKAKLNSASISTPQYAMGTYVDASNYTALLIDSTTATFRKRIAGVNYDATKALTMVAGTNYKIIGRVNVDNTLDIFVQGAKGTGNANTTAPQAKSDKTYQIGSDGASANQLYAGIISSGIKQGTISDAEAIRITTP